MPGEEDFDDAHEDDLETPETLEPDEDLGSDGEDDQPEDLAEPDDEDDVEPVEAEPAPQTRGASRIAALAAERSAAIARAEAAERRAAEAEARARSEDFTRQEEERLAMMSPEERVEYRVNQRVSRIEMSTWDTNDRVSFEGLANRNPAVGALKDEVETMFRQRLAAGQPVDRTTIATFLIGQKALARAPRAKAAGKRATEAGRDRNAVRPSSSRGDVAPTGRRSGSEAEARRRRLENVEI